MKNVFDKAVANELVDRLSNLNSTTQVLWGKMNVGQVMAHCCVTYEYVYETSHKKPGGLKKFLLTSFVKKGVVGDKPYSKNLRTAPDFLMREDKDFEAERKRLIDYINKTQELGEEYFDGKESHSFGTLNKKEWNAMFYKHLDHHLGQLGV